MMRVYLNMDLFECMYILETYNIIQLIGRMKSCHITYKQCAIHDKQL